MADERSTGLILRTRLLTETSLIVQWLTPDLGRISTVAKGARRQKSNFRGKLDLFYLADFSFARSARSELHTLREVVLRDTHSPLRDDITRLQQAAYAAGLIEQTVETETPVPEIFDLACAYLRHVVSVPPSVAAVFAFELKLLEQLGLAPELDTARLSPESRQAAETLIQGDWAEIRAGDLLAAQQNELRQFLHGFLIYHLGKIPRSRAEALHV